ncbi:MFS transporter [Klebsiella variicola subsp. variicola]|nr:MFS transporter [Klebsiella variicola subsp. variicola]
MAETTFTLWRQRLGYGIADLSCNLVWQMISLYLMFFYTDVMGLPAYYVGLMFLVTRLVDGVADVLMGLVIDNTATRWGRCRPWLLIGALPFWSAVFWPFMCRISAPLANCCTPLSPICVCRSSTPW